MLLKVWLVDWGTSVNVSNPVLGGKSRNLQYTFRNVDDYVTE